MLTLRSAPPGEPGLLIAPVTPRTPFLGYAGSPELSEQKLLRGAFADGDTFFSTGDLMEEDCDGFVRFCDRIGDTFRSAPPYGNRRRMGTMAIWEPWPYGNRGHMGIMAIWELRPYGNCSHMGTVAIWEPRPYGTDSPMGPMAVWDLWPHGTHSPMGPMTLWHPQPYGTHSPMGPTALWDATALWDHATLWDHTAL